MKRLERQSTGGFTMVELITVLVVMGILGAIGAARFFDKTTFENRAYADQVKSLVRYAQKLAISQNRAVFVSTEPTRFAVCFTAGCAAQNVLALAPGGANSGSTSTRANCRAGGAYVGNWLCEAPPSGVQLAGTGLAVGAAFYFDSLGRPYNSGDAVGASTFGTRTYSFTSGGSTFTLNIEPETGYVYNVP